MSSSGGLASDGKVYCKHMEEAARYKSGTAQNPNRDFYCCRKSKGDPNRCNFWYWANRVPRMTDGVAQELTSSVAESPPPRPSMDVGPTTQSIATPPARSSQQQSSPALRTPSDTPQRRKRLEAIEAGLRQREGDGASRQPGPSRGRGPSTSPCSQANRQPPSPVPTDVESEAETPPQRSSFLGLWNFETSSSTMQESGQPSTPKKRRISSSIERTEIQPITPGGSFGGGSLLTPPRSTRRTVQPDGFVHVSPTPRSRKGKEREVVPPVRTQYQGTSGGPSQEEDSLPVFTAADETSSTSSVSPTIAENVLDYNDGIRARVKALSEYMDSFDVSEAGKLLQTIERQKNQYECRDRSQKMRIGELILEKEELAAEILRLKEELSRFEERSREQDEEIESCKALMGSEFD